MHPAIRHEPGTVLHLLSDVRSGSTLISQLLAGHRQIVTVGELQWLRAYVTGNRDLYDPPHALVCACGLEFTLCPFWEHVRTHCVAPLEDLDLMPSHFGWDARGTQPGVLGQLLRKLGKNYPAASTALPLSMLFGSSRVAAASFMMYEALFRSTQASVVVDTSKNILRARMVYQSHPERVRLLVLRRDYRAIIYAKMKRGRTVRDASVSWIKRATQIASLVACAPDDSVLYVRYENFCAGPSTELDRIIDFLRLPPEDVLVARASGHLHDIGGSPSKFSTGPLKIAVDDEYLQKLSPSQLRTIETIAASTARDLGYDEDY